MNKWITVATQTLLAKSAQANDFNKAKEEWFVTEKVFDSYLLQCNELPACELCHHEKIRWQFEIQNKINKNTLLVGSTCITKFDIPASTNNITFFHGKIRDSLLLYRIKIIKDQYIKNHILELLNQTKNNEDNNKIKEIERFWIENECFTPQMAYEFINKCKQNSINIHEIVITITLRKIDYRIEILHMKNDEYSLIIPYLGENQILRCNKIRHVIEKKT